jgi:hypothetical protein
VDLAHDGVGRVGDHHLDSDVLAALRVSCEHHAPIAALAE